MMKKFLSLSIFAMLILAFTVGLKILPAHAASNSNLIDDGVFDNTSAMGAAQIDSWLNGFAGSCISPNSGFTAADPTGYSPNANFVDGHYTYGSAVSAGRVIYDAAVAHGINPQVLLTKLQNEEQLVDGSAGCDNWRYTSAVGYACTDSGTNTHNYTYTGTDPYSSGSASLYTLNDSSDLVTPLYYKNGTPITSITGSCVNTNVMAGFSQQVVHAAWALSSWQHKSEGQTSWAAVGGNWNHCEDNNTCVAALNIPSGWACYSHLMTQGTFKRCPTDTQAVYYDGLATIDSTSVHMDTGATAALYVYTPHFQSFTSIFSNWFGSTQFPQPVGGSLLYQSSTGRIYLTTDTTRYYVPSWAMMTNYGLDAYPVLPVSDTTVQQYSDGGDLTNLIIDSGGVYLVNNHGRYHLSPSMCTAWGLSCFDNTVVKSLGSAFQTGYLQTNGELSQLSLWNGVIYEMSNGQKQPIANPRTLSDLGLGNTPVIVASAVNSSQPLGPLLITTPGVVQLSPASPLYYFDGSTYYLIYNMNSYFDWALTKAPLLSVPISSYATVLPTSTPLSLYVTSGGVKYVIDQGRKLAVPAALGAIWPDAQFTSPPSDALLNALPSLTLSQNVYTEAGVFVLAGGQKHYVASTDDFPGLNIAPATITKLRSDKLQSVASGVDAFPDGKLILTTNDGKIYVVNNHGLTYIPDPSTFTAYGYDWGKVFGYPLSVTSEYPIDSNILGSTVNPSGDAFVIANGTLYKLPAVLATDYGIINSKLSAISDRAIKKTNIPTLPRFLYNSNDGKIYYASGNAIHYVSSLTSFIAYGGLSSRPAVVNSQLISLFTIAQPI